MVYYGLDFLIDTSFLVPLGLFLLYLPPFFAFIFTGYLNQNRATLSYRNIISYSFVLFLIMIVLMPEVYYTFWLYFIMFNSLFFFVDRLTLDRALALRLSV